MSDHCHPAYEVIYFDRLDQRMPSPPKVTQIEYGRKLDDESRATVSYDLATTDCCEQLGRLESIAHKMGIYENGSMVWYGWLEDIEYKAGQAIVPAFDAFGWAGRRIVHSDHDFTDVDLTDIFVAIWNDGMDPDPISAELITFPSGVTETKMILASEIRYIESLIRDMLDTGLDLTVVGQKIIAGVIPTTQPIELRLADFALSDQEGLSLVKKGSKFASRIIVDASEAVQGIWPPGPPAPTELYPLVEHIIQDANIQDIDSAQNAAKSRYEYSRRVPRLLETGESLALQPNVNVEIKDLIPGIRLIIDTEGLCYSTKQEYRLGSVDVTVAAGERKIAISTQPTGSRDSLADADDPLT